MATRKKVRRLTPVQKAKLEVAAVLAHWNQATEALQAEQRKRHELQTELDAVRALEKATAAALDQLRTHIYVFSAALRRDAENDRVTSHVSGELLKMLAALVPVVPTDLLVAEEAASVTNAKKGG